MDNPNTQHQIWSKWSFRVKLGSKIPPRIEVTRFECARFGRVAFGTYDSNGTQMRVDRSREGYIVEVMTEGWAVHDIAFREHMRMNWEKFFVAGLGPGTVVEMEAKLMAGNRQDGKPAEQLLVLPELELGDFNG